MIVSYSLFQNSASIRPIRRDRTWTSFVSDLGIFSTMARPATDEEKVTNTPAISPALYAPGTTRNNLNVEAWGGWVGLDVDDPSGLHPGAIDDVFRCVNRVLYTTTGATAAQPRYRLILHLDRFVLRGEVRRFWSGLFEATGQMIDRACKDPARIYFVPATWLPTVEYPEPFALFQAETNAAPMDVDSVLALAASTAEHQPSPSIIHAVQGVAVRRLDMVPPGALEEFRRAPQGGRMWRFLICCAGHSIRNGYAVTVGDLVACARQAEGHERPGINREAQRALSYAVASPRAPTPKRIGLFGH